MGYYTKIVEGNTVVFDSVTNGAIAPDGNDTWDTYEAWVAEGNKAQAE